MPTPSPIVRVLTIHLLPAHVVNFVGSPTPISVLTSSFEPCAIAAAAGIEASSGIDPGRTRIEFRDTIRPRALPPVRDAVEDPRGAAAGVEHELVATEVEAVDDVTSHRDLRVRDTVVGAGIPFAR